MKKSTILTFATVVAIVATSAGTFAAWDQLEDTSDVANLVVGTPVTVQAGTLTTFSEESRVLGDTLPSYTSTVEFNVVDNNSKVSTLTLQPILTDSSDQPIDSSKATIEITQDGADNGLTGNVDSKVEATNTYNVKVSVKDASLAGETLKVSVKGTLQ